MNKLRQRAEWYWLGKVFFDVGGDRPLLPNS